MTETPKSYHLDAEPAHVSVTSGDGKLTVKRVRLGRWEFILALIATIGTFGTFVIEVGRSARWWGPLG
jgi:hypothetical protein